MLASTNVSSLMLGLMTVHKQYFKSCQTSQKIFMGAVNESIVRVKPMVV